MEKEGQIYKFMSALKADFINSDDFDYFEQFVYSQTEELRLLKIHNETLRNSLNTCEDEKRSLELQLVAEKANRAQETKNVDLEKEKAKIQFDTHMYSMKCEVELQKRKTEAITMELDLLKEQLKTLEYEKGDALRKLHSLTGNKTDFDQVKSSCDAFQKRIRETVKTLERNFMQIRDVKDNATIAIEESQRMIENMNVSIKNLEQTRTRWEQRAIELERELVCYRAENEQNKAKLERSEYFRESTSTVIEQMATENSKLFQGFNLFSTALGNDICDSDNQFLEKVKRIHGDVQESIKRLKVE